jgi:prevent-host-death family protein
MKIASLVEMKTHFSAYVKASAQGPVVVTRNGKPVAVLLAVTDEEELERLLIAHSPRLQAILNAARKRIQAGQGIPADQFWAEVEGDQGAAKQRRGKRRKLA